MVVRNDEQLRDIKSSLANLLEYFSEDRSGCVDPKTLSILKNELIVMECKLKIYSGNYKLNRKFA